MPSKLLARKLSSPDITEVDLPAPVTRKPFSSRLPRLTPLRCVLAVALLTGIAAGGALSFARLVRPGASLSAASAAIGVPAPAAHVAAVEAHAASMKAPAVAAKMAPAAARMAPVPAAAEMAHAAKMAHAPNMASAAAAVKPVLQRLDDSQVGVVQRQVEPAQARDSAEAGKPVVLDYVVKQAVGPAPAVHTAFKARRR